MIAGFNAARRGLSNPALAPESIRHYISGGEANMKWERPDFIEIGMNAEIGGYQSDFGDGDPAGPRGPVLDTSSSDETDTRTPHAS